MARRKVVQDKEMDNICFEEALGKLEGIVKQLEKGELPLEDSLAQFGEGMALSQLCLTKLNAAEKQVDKIIQEEQGRLTEKKLEFAEDARC